jgi:hypothetical protein
MSDVKYRYFIRMWIYVKKTGRGKQRAYVHRTNRHPWHDFADDWIKAFRQMGWELWALSSDEQCCYRVKD